MGLRSVTIGFERGIANFITLGSSESSGSERFLLCVGFKELNMFNHARLRNYDRVYLFSVLLLLSSTEVGINEIFERRPRRNYMTAVEPKGQEGRLRCQI